MKIAFRADGDPHIGTGHLSRCGAIALACMERQLEVCFYSREGSLSWLRAQGLPFEILPIFPTVAEETAFFIKKAGQWGAAWAVIDSYRLDTESYAATHAAMKSMVVDDYARLPYRADIFLNANLYAPALDCSHIQAEKFLLGGQYAILRKEFQLIPPAPFHEDVRRILITMGGADINSYTPFVLEALRDIEVEEILVILGAYARCQDAVQAAAKQCKSPVRILIAPPNIAALFASCDLAISAAGSTVYELCVLGVPSILIQQADNQRLIREYFQRTPSMSALEDYGHVSAQQIANETLSLIHSADRRKTMRETMMRLVTRFGVSNIVDALITT